MIEDPNVAALAAQTVALVGPYLTSLAGKAGETAAGEVGKQAFEWLKGKFTGGAARAVLDEAIAEPERKSKLRALEAQIEAAAEEDELFRRELANLLVKAGGVKSSVIFGDRNVVVQADGSVVRVNTEE